MAWIAPAASAAAGIFAGLHHPKTPNYNAIIARYRASRPAGYTTPEDAAAAERTRTRIAGAATATAARARAMNERQITSRGLSGPAAAALEQNATDIEAQGGEQGAAAANNQLYNAFQSNLGYSRGQNDTAFGAEMGAAYNNAALANARDATFWNSAMEAIPAISGMFPTGGSGFDATPDAGTDITGGAHYTDNWGTTGGATTTNSYGPNTAYGPNP